MINYLAGAPYPDNRIPQRQLSPISLSALKLIPLGNLSPSLFSSTQMLTNDYDQGGFRFHHYFSDSDQIYARYVTSSQHVLDPLPINGSSVPGFPAADNFRTHSATASWVHCFSPAAVQTARVAFFRNAASIEAAQNHTPASSLGFTYQPTLPEVTGTPYLIVSGFSNIGNPITGRRTQFRTIINPSIRWQSRMIGTISSSAATSTGSR